MLGVLMVSLCDASHRHSRHQQRRRDARQALAWFRSDDESHPFTCGVVCETLGVPMGVARALAERITTGTILRLSRATVTNRGSRPTEVRQIPELAVSGR